MVIGELSTDVSRAIQPATKNASAKHLQPYGLVGFIPSDPSFFAVDANFEPLASVARNPHAEKLHPRPPGQAQSRMRRTCVSRGKYLHRGLRFESCRVLEDLKIAA